MTEYYHTLLEKGGRTAEEKAAVLKWLEDMRNPSMWDDAALSKENSND
jgi:hypothetical protein